MDHLLCALRVLLMLLLLHPESFVRVVQHDMHWKLKRHKQVGAAAEEEGEEEEEDRSVGHGEGGVWRRSSSRDVISEGLKCNYFAV